MTDDAPAPEAEATEVLQLLDPEKMTMGELEEFEDMVGTDLVNAVFRGVMSPRAISALAFLTKRRLDPKVTLEDIRALEFGEIDIGPGSEDEAEAEDEAPNAPGSAG